MDLEGYGRIIAPDRSRWILVAAAVAIASGCSSDDPTGIPMGTLLSEQRRSQGEEQVQAPIHGKGKPKPSSGFQREVKLNIIEHSQSGRMKVTANTPFDIGQMRDIFDGNSDSLARTPSVNPLIVTLAIDTSRALIKSRVLMITDGFWSLDLADSLDDLDQQTGTFRRIVDSKFLINGEFDEVSFPEQQAKFARLTVTRINGDDYVHLNEWELFANVTINRIKVIPENPIVLPGKTLALKAKYIDDGNFTYPIEEAVTWRSKKTAIATVDAGGNLKGVQLGSTTLNISANGLTSTHPVEVKSFYRPTADAPKTVKVAVVIRNPAVSSHGYQPFHSLYGFGDPDQLVPTIISEFNNSTHGVVNLQVVETIYLPETDLFTSFYGSTLTIDQQTSFYDSGNWGDVLNEASSSGNLQFEYNRLLSAYQLCEKRNAGLIDEVWIYADPFGGLYESRLAGPNAFWYNSPPLPDTTCERLLPIMGFNFERGTAEAIHSFGHRIESAMVQATGRWDTYAADRNPWEKFSSLGDGGHVGNTHFPVNAWSDYDYGSSNVVTSYAENWKYYPYLYDTTTQVSCSDWDCSELQYYQWMYSRIPRYTGISDGLLNNWWWYVFDYEGATERASALTAAAP